MIARTIALGLVCWLVTEILVESALLAPARARVKLWAQKHQPIETFLAPDPHWRSGSPEWWMSHGGMKVYGDTEPLKALFVIDQRKGETLWRDRIAYLVACNLCAGTWVGLGLAAIADGPIDVPFVGWLLSGLLYKAIAHQVLALHQLVTRVAT